MATNEEATPRPTESAVTQPDAPVSDQDSSPLFVLRAMGRATRRLFGNWRTLILFVLLYAALVASLYFFISIREASVWQVLSTFLLAVLAPVLFFIIQAMGTRYVESGVRVKELLGWSLKNFWKLLVMTLPLLLLAWLIVYLFRKFQVDATAAVSEASRAASTDGGGAAAATHTAAPRAAGDVFSWKEVILSTLRFLILWLILPLMAIHLWIAAARDGLGGAFRNIPRVLGRALAPGAVLVYVLGLLFFGVLPYFLITINFSRGGAWTEISLLSVRLALAALCILFGWLITLGALSILNPERVRTKTEEENEVTPAE